MYAPGAGPDPRNDDFESWLGSHIDGPSAPVVAKLCEGRELVPHELLVLSRFVVSQRLRTPLQRDKILSTATRYAKLLVEKWRADPALMRADIEEAYAAGGRSNQEAALEIEQWESLLGSNEPLQIRALKFFWLDFINTSIRRTALEFGVFDYLVFEPPGSEEFATSDSPVLRRYDHAILRRCLGEPGWLSPRTEISLPLAPNRMLLSRKETSRAYRRLQVVGALASRPSSERTPPAFQSRAPGLGSLAHRHRKGDVLRVVAGAARHAISPERRGYVQTKRTACPQCWCSHPRAICSVSSSTSTTRHPHLRRANCVRVLSTIGSTWGANAANFASISGF